MAEHRRSVAAAELDTPMLAYVDAVELIEQWFTPLEPATRALDDCLGLVLAQDVVASDDVPAFGNSAMDGYAARATDGLGGSVVLTVGDEISPGVVVKVMTGQPIPDGADCVIPWEEATSADTASIEITGGLAVGRFVRPQGEDVKAGQWVFGHGTILGPLELSMAAALGWTHLRVIPAPRVGVLSTGDELVGVSEAVGVGRVRDSNAPLIAAIARSLGAEVVSVQRTVDDPAEIRQALEGLARSCDLIITSGGASVGEKDWVRSVLEQYGSVAMWRVAMRPGKPVALGRFGEARVVVLPGNPGSVVACSHVVVGRGLRAMAGRPAAPSSVPRQLGGSIEGDAVRTVIQPVTQTDGAVQPIQAKSSQALSGSLGLTGWVIVPPGGLDSGVTVEVETLP